MPLLVICSCKHQMHYADAFRGLEQSCQKCGRVFRLPMNSQIQKLDLAHDSFESTPDTYKNFQRLARLSGFSAASQRVKRRLRLLLFICLGAILFALAFTALFLMT